MPFNPITHLLTHSRTIAVVGLSPDPARTSHDVARAMQLAGFRIVPVNPMAAGSRILDEPVFASLADAAAGQPPGQGIDLVNIFRRSPDVPPVVADAIAIGAKGIWMQLGIAHAEAAAQAEAAGLTVVQDRCIKTECRRHGIRCASNQ